VKRPIQGCPVNTGLAAADDHDVREQSFQAQFKLVYNFGVKLQNSLFRNGKILIISK
jgi:hypothetical protein